MNQLRFGGVEREYLLLTIGELGVDTDLQFLPDTWLKCEAEVASGHFFGRVCGGIGVYHLEDFKRDLKRLHTELFGDVSFMTDEDWFRLNITGDGKGHLTASVRLWDDARRVLEAQVAFDQTQLPPAIRYLSDILAKFLR